MKFFNSFIIILVLFSLNALGQNKITQEEYIKLYKDIAMQKMKEYKIPASITLAQGILESGSGNSVLARKANNHFGIKCHGWAGGKYYFDGDVPNECFRKYKKIEESYHDHSLFLTQRQRYADLFKLKADDYKGWAHGLKKAGYATNPNYPNLLITLIERHNLTQYDALVLGKKTSKPTKTEDPKPSITTPSKTYKSVNVSDFKVTGKTKSGRFVYTNNRVKLIFAQEGDDVYSLAKELNVYSKQLLAYNDDLTKDGKMKKGQIVYIERKKAKSHEFQYHTIQQGETLSYVSQLYGIKLKNLFKMNKMSEKTVLQVGTNIKLN
ncbi:MAG: glucosaminidase domain-containing protein [Lentimicrobiaceae bacterium]|jgi:uncharacterized FlgJ-related protein|nr:glucosaminidase domain-containing protein [Lentimicrobiaceae bacterium]